MTRDEYMKAGRMNVPVVCRGKQYSRIVEVVITFASSKERDAIHRNVPKEIVHLRLIDSTGHYNCALPENVEVDPEIVKLYPGVFGNAET